MKPEIVFHAICEDKYWSFREPFLHLFIYVTFCHQSPPPTNQLRVAQNCLHCIIKMKPHNKKNFNFSSGRKTKFLLLCCRRLCVISKINLNVYFLEDQRLHHHDETSSSVSHSLTFRSCFSSRCVFFLQPRYFETINLSFYSHRVEFFFSFFTSTLAWLSMDCVGWKTWNFVKEIFFDWVKMIWHWRVDCWGSRIGFIRWIFIRIEKE